MALAGAANLQASQAHFEALWQNLWNQPQAGYACKELVEDVACPNSKYLRVPVVTSYPRVRQWLGAKAVKDLRAFELSVEVLPYEATIGLKRLDVTTDQTGAVNSSLTGFANASMSANDDLLITALLANTWTSYDGVALMSASHTFMNSTGNNLTTSALTFSTYRTGKEAMADFTDEDGKPLNIFPTHLLVGHAQERIAKEIIGAERPIYFNASAAEATSSVVGGVVIPNVYQGDVKLIVSPWITGNQWFLIHKSPGLSPFVRAVHREFETQVQDGRDMSNVERFMKDMFHYSIEGDVGFGAGLHQCIYGSVTA